MKEPNKYKCPDCKPRGCIIMGDNNIGTCTQGKKFILRLEGLIPEFEVTEKCPRSKKEKGEKFPAILLSGIFKVI